MISLIIVTKNIRTGSRRKVTDITFPLLKKIDQCEVLISDNGSTDETEDFIKDLKLKYVYTEPNEGEFLNMSKCLNNAIINHAKHDIIVPAGTDFIFPSNFGKETEKIFNDFNKRIENQVECVFSMVRPREFDFDVKTYQIIERWNSFNYSYTKEMYFKANGYDERIVSWGGEDTDFRERLGRRLDVETIVPNEIFLLHIKHPKTFENECRAHIHRRNMRIVNENRMQKSANMINSYLPKEE